VKGALYGTTFGGGANCTVASDCGTVFGITTSGTVKVLYSFKGYPDGAHPHTRLLNVNSTLYGATTFGGANNGGTVFAFRP
jgi:uncharacterized repeat protein (TIGR03803 family)